MQQVTHGQYLDMMLHISKYWPCTAYYATDFAHLVLHIVRLDPKDIDYWAFANLDVR